MFFLAAKKRLPAWFLTLLLATSSVCADTTVWDPVNSPFFGGGGFDATVPGTNGGIEFVFSDSAFGNAVYGPSGGGGGAIFPSSSDTDGVVRVTARTLDDNDLGSIVNVILGEPNAGIGRRELFQYSILVEDFGSDIVSIDIPVNAPSFIFNTDLAGGGFDGNPLNGIAEFDVNGLDLFLLQTPTADGFSTTNPGNAALELISVELVTIPEPTSFAIVMGTFLTLLRRRR